MNRILASQLIAMTLAGFASNSYADTEKSIYGKTDLAINQTETFSDARLQTDKAAQR